MEIATDKLALELKENFKDSVAAVSVGLRDDNLFVDLDYQEDLQWIEI